MFFCPSQGLTIHISFKIPSEKKPNALLENPLSIRRGRPRACPVFGCKRGKAETFADYFSNLFPP
jgi:hypothetical protein